MGGPLGVTLGRSRCHPHSMATQLSFHSPGHFYLSSSTLPITAATSALGCDLLPPALRPRSQDRSPAQPLLLSLWASCLPPPWARPQGGSPAVILQPGSHPLLLLKDVTAIVVSTLPCDFTGVSLRFHWSLPGAIHNC